ncbi:MAG: benzoyl-CoA reductase subunit C [Fidelibacterota bacterium]
MFPDYESAIQQTRKWVDDLTFTYALEWKKQKSSRRIVGFLPIYVPREIIVAGDMLPVGIFGAGDRLPVVHGDAYFQSYICHLPRTVIELALRGHLDQFDSILFPAICDVIRNLSGIFKLKFKDKYIRYLDFPQNMDPEVGGKFYRTELEELVKSLQKLNGVTIDNKRLNKAISLYNENRRLLQEVSSFRSEYPHLIPVLDYYLLRRAGNIISVQDHNRLLAAIMSLAPQVQREPEDKIRVVLSGSFCEQPPLGLLQTIENAGCYIIDDDLQLGLTWIQGEIPANTDDPLGALVDSYLSQSALSSAVYDRDHLKGEKFAQYVTENRVDGVIFCAPSFCDPALLDRPQLEQAMDRQHIRHFSFQYHENLGQFHVIKEQAGTFADMIKLWE